MRTSPRCRLGNAYSASPPACRTLPRRPLRRGPCRFSGGVREVPTKSVHPDPCGTVPRHSTSDSGSFHSNPLAEIRGDMYGGSERYAHCTPAVPQVSLRGSGQRLLKLRSVHAGGNCARWGSPVRVICLRRGQGISSAVHVFRGPTLSRATHLPMPSFSPHARGGAYRSDIFGGSRWPARASSRLRRPAGVPHRILMDLPTRCDCDIRSGIDFYLRAISCQVTPSTGDGRWCPGFPPSVRNFSAAALRKDLRLLWENFLHRVGLVPCSHGVFFAVQSR